MSRTTISEHAEVRRPEGGEDTGTAHGSGFSRALRGVALAVAACAGALLSVGAFLGLSVRPTSDDWCALWKARDMGVLGITADFYLTQNGRVTNAFLTGLLYSDDMRGPKLLPAFLVVALGLGLFLLARAALRALRPATRAGEEPVVPLLAAVALLSALLFFAGTRSYQVLLWAPATISHTLPSVIGLWAVLGGVRAVRGGVRWAKTAAVVSALLTGVVVGMLSEPFTLVAGLFSVSVGLVCLPRFGWARDRYVSTWCAAACLGLLVGLIVLSTSPGARWRRAQHPQEPLSAERIGETFHDWWRLWQTVGGQWAYLGALAVGALLGLALAAGPRRGDGVPDTHRGQGGDADRAASGLPAGAVPGGGASAAAADRPREPGRRLRAARRIRSRRLDVRPHLDELPPAAAARPLRVRGMGRPRPRAARPHAHAPRRTRRRARGGRRGRPRQRGRPGAAGVRADHEHGGARRGLGPAERPHPRGGGGRLSGTSRTARS